MSYALARASAWVTMTKKLLKFRIYCLDKYLRLRVRKRLGCMIVNIFKFRTICTQPSLKVVQVI